MQQKVEPRQNSLQNRQWKYAQENISWARVPQFMNKLNLAAGDFINGYKFHIFFG